MRRIKKGYIIFLILSLICLQTFAQKEGNIWCFPDRCGIDFNNTLNLDTFSSAVGSMGLGFPLGNQCSISDSSGNLFCYAAATDWTMHALYVWDKNHQIMPHGNNLQGHPNLNSLLLPYPGLDSLICLFHFGIDSLNSNFYRFFFSTINKNLNGGYGDIVIKDSLIYYGTVASYSSASVRHANGRDWWIIIRNYASGAYIKYLLTPAGISFQDSTIIGSQSYFFGRMAFSHDGSKLMTVEVPGIIDVFDFDRCNGQLSNYRDIGEHIIGNQAYQYFNCEFSPNGNVIYVSPWNVKKVFYQWNLSAGDITAVRASKTLLNEYSDTGLYQSSTYFLHKLGPDGKIYIPISFNYGPDTPFTHYLDVIENPDVPGLGCNYIQQAFNLGSHFVAGDLPNIPYYGLGADSGSVCDSLVGIHEVTSKENSIEIFPNPSAGILSLRLRDVNDKIILIRVEDLIGKEVFSNKNSFPTVDITNQPAGIYFVHATTQKKKLFVAKAVKE
jgi:hypothetical protein